MDPFNEHQLALTRRELLGSCCHGIGTAGLAGLLTRDGFAIGPAAQSGNVATGPVAINSRRIGGLPDIPHFAAKAKRVIYLFMNGGPTHVDLFDWKPKLAELHGKPLPEGYADNKRFSTMTGNAQGKLMLAPVEPFQQHGACGAWVSSFMPHTAKIVDDLCFVKSMHTDAVNHAPAISFLLSGAQLPGRPTLGAWMSYGLGSETDELPAYVALTSVSKGTSCGQIFYEFYWGSGFLPSRYQGVKFRSGNEPVLYLANPAGMTSAIKRDVLDDLAELNRLKLGVTADPEISTRIAQYEMAFRMQTSVPELADFSNEQNVLESYGPQVAERGASREIACWLDD